MYRSLTTRQPDGLSQIKFMNQDKNSKLNTILLIILIILVALLFLYVMSLGKEEKKTNYTTEQDSSVKSDTSFDWKTLSQKDILSLIPIETFVPESGIGLTKTVDLTGDGINEAVFTGNGGNNNLSIIIMRNSDNTFSVANEKNKNGSINPVELYEIGRVMVQEKFELLPSEHGFYTISLSYDQNTEKFECKENGVNAYIWNDMTKLFEWNQSLTLKYEKIACPK